MIRCPYIENKVWCNKRQSEDDEEERYMCDSCYVLWGDCWDQKEE